MAAFSTSMFLLVVSVGNYHPILCEIQVQTIHSDTFGGLRGAHPDNGCNGSHLNSCDYVLVSPSRPSGLHGIKTHSRAVWDSLAGFGGT